MRRDSASGRWEELLDAESIVKKAVLPDGRPAGYVMGFEQGGEREVTYGPATEARVYEEFGVGARDRTYLRRPSSTVSTTASGQSSGKGFPARYWA